MTAAGGRWRGTSWNGSRSDRRHPGLGITAGQLRKDFHNCPHPTPNRAVTRRREAPWSDRSFPQSIYLSTLRLVIGTLILLANSPQASEADISLRWSTHLAQTLGNRPPPGIRQQYPLLPVPRKYSPNLS